MSVTKVSVPVKITGEAEQALKAIEEVKTKLVDMQNANNKSGLNKELGNLVKILDTIRNKTSQDFSSDAGLAGLLEKIGTGANKVKDLQKEIDKIRSAINKGNKTGLDILPDDSRKKVDTALQGLKNLKDAEESYQKTKNKEISAQEKTIENIKERQESLPKLKQQEEDIIKKQQEQLSILNQIRDTYEKITELERKQKTSEGASAIKARNKLSELQTKQTDAKTIADNDSTKLQQVQDEQKILQNEIDILKNPKKGEPRYLELRSKGGRRNKAEREEYEALQLKRAEELKQKEETFAKNNTTISKLQEKVNKDKEALNSLSEAIKDAQKKVDNFDFPDSKKKELQALKDSIEIQNKSLIDAGGKAVDKSTVKKHITTTTNKIATNENDLKSIEEEITNTPQKLVEAEEALKNLKQQLADTTSSEEFKEALEKVMQSAQECGIVFEDGIGLEDFKQLLSEVGENELNDFLKSIGLTDEQLQKINDTLENFKEQTRESRTALEEENQAMQDTAAIKSRIIQFFSLTNAIELARRALQGAVQTIKELDSVMTEAAVVTSYSINDMWKQLPEYADNASKMGSSIRDMYSASTLYYQQGLKGVEVTDLATQTLKLARIAGLDASEATDRMTAALRGFNMELNNTSAENVADVYSKLAAITASDVDEISVAMTKTASIAHSAGMEFETTAAFLSQIINITVTCNSNVA